MSLEVIVASASSLPNVESVGKTDPYVSIEYQGEVTLLLCWYLHVSLLHRVVYVYTSHCFRFFFRFYQYQQS